MGLGLTYLAFIAVNLQFVLRYSADAHAMVGIGVTRTMLYPVKQQ